MLKLFILICVLLINTFASTTTTTTTTTSSSDANSNTTPFVTKFSWESSIDYDPQSINANEQIGDSKHNSSGNIIYGMNFWKEKIFFSLMEYKSSWSPALYPLSYINRKSTENSPLLIPYPKDDLDRLQSTQSVHLEIDSCDRLWYIDYSHSRLFVIDLNHDKVIRETNLPTQYGPSNSSYIKLIVDVAQTGRENCDNSTYAYIPIVPKFALLVYRFSDGAVWLADKLTLSNSGAGASVTSPQESSYRGIAAATLTEPKPNGYKVLYFQTAYTPDIFAISTQLLQNQPTGTSTDTSIKQEYVHVGTRGDNLEYYSDDILYHQPTGILFYDLPRYSSIGCWNTRRFPNELSINTTSTFELPDRHLHWSLIQDLQFDEDNGNLWVNLFFHVRSGTNRNRIYSSDISGLVKGTKCEPLSGQ